MSKSRTPFWDERLVCEVVSLTYDFRSRTGRLHFPPGNCCDMTGCIDLFKRIDPQVVAIYTFSGAEADTIYRKEGKEWRAFNAVLKKTETIPS